MTVDQIRATLQETPFQPFEIHVADGRSFAVKHPDFLLIGPDRRTIFVFEGSGGMFNILDLRLVTGIRVPTAPAPAPPSP